MGKAKKKSTVNREFMTILWKKIFFMENFWNKRKIL